MHGNVSNPAMTIDVEEKAKLAAYQLNNMA